MDYNTLITLATDLGYELAMSGAETFRVEESITRVLASYGVQAEVFAIPNFLIVTILTADGTSITRSRRIGYHGTDLDAVEKFNGLSRALCNRCPNPQTALEWLEMVRRSKTQYSFLIYLLGNFMGGAGFSLLFGCGWWDFLWAGICGIFVGLVNHLMDKLRVNPFFSTLSAAFVLAAIAYTLHVLGIIQYVDGVIIGALMMLVPGLLFTNAMRDIIYGDTNSGVNRIVQVLLVALAIAVGTAVGWNIISYFTTIKLTASAIDNSLLITCFGTIIGCVGFSILFNIHGPGGTICALGGLITWIIYFLTMAYGGSDVMGCFYGSVFASVYAEVMARVRKYPAISYLVVSIFPIIPGAGIYFAMSHAVHGDMEAFSSRGTHTAAIAGVMAVGIMMISTLVKVYNNWKQSQYLAAKSSDAIKYH